MEYFVRFTHGDAGGAIGFHTIPVDDGARVKTTAQLGAPLSHGCVRQRTADATAPEASPQSARASSSPPEPAAQKSLESRAAWCHGFGVVRER